MMEMGAKHYGMPGQIGTQGWNCQPCGHSGMGHIDLSQGCPVCNHERRIVKEAMMEALKEYFGDKPETSGNNSDE